MMRAAVLSPKPSISVDNLALRFGRTDALFPKVRVDKACIISVRDEADLLAIILLGHGELKLSRKLAHLRFDHATQRKQGACELLLCQPEKKICLIFVGIQARTHLISTTRLIQTQTSIMPCCNLFCAYSGGHLEKLIELNEVVA